jgi:predicted ATP-grasp superfamily ATP-dependent carboligase
MWPRLKAGGIQILAQEAVAGDETRVESYHAYVDPGGDLVAAFTGRKIRTLPNQYGHSSALVITEEPDVDELGRDIVRRLEIRGVVKIDFKRAADDRLWLLEINPRFTLWHHPAAIAGLNIPAIVHADLTGRPRPAFGPARAGVTWCHPSYDVRAAHAAGVSFGAWLRFVRGCDAVSPGTLVAPVTRRLELLH